MTSRIPLALACLAGAALLPGCGDDVPANSVAKVGDSTITKAEFDKWLRTAAMGQAEGGKASVPKPPDFAACVAQRRKQPAQPGQSAKRDTAALKKECKTEYDRLKGEVMQFLIQAQWVQQEAEARDVKVSDQEVRKSFEDQKKQAFKSAKDYTKFLQTSGQSEQDILFRVKLDTLQTKLTQKITEDEAKISDDDLREYYDKNKRRFAQPERRDLAVVLTKNKGRADAAKAELQKGGSFKDVAKKYSIDEASKGQGGKLSDVAKGQQEKALDDAVFKAKRNQLVGPVKTQFGWYVFKVTDTTPASQQSFDKAKENIRNILKSERQQKALDDFVKDFREEYKDKTNCAKGFVVAECKNAPKQETDTTAPGQPGVPQQGAPPSGAPPQGAPPQGAPPSGAPPQGVPPSGAPQGPPPSGATPPSGGAPPTPAPAPQGPASP